MKLIQIPLLCLAIALLTSCNQYIKSGIAGSTDVSLTRNSDEYTIKRLKPIELEGSSLFGIPGFGTNNKNKNKTGMVFKLNGFTIGSVPRILPILSFLSTSVASGLIIQSIAGQKEVQGPNQWYTEYKNRMPTSVGILLGIPVGGMINNLVWSGSATSGLTNQMYYRLVDENPDVDIFTNPKYKIDYKLGVFNQKATIRADVMGATLKLK
jgi:hypothetical protein